MRAALLVDVSLLLLVISVARATARRRAVQRRRRIFSGRTVPGERGDW